MVHGCLQGAQNESPASADIDDLPPGFSVPNIVQVLENVSSLNHVANVVPSSTAVSIHPIMPVSELVEGSIPPGFETVAAVLASKEQHAKGLCSFVSCINIQ